MSKIFFCSCEGSSFVGVGVIDTSKHCAEMLLRWRRRVGERGTRFFHFFLSYMTEYAVLEGYKSVFDLSLVCVGYCVGT